MQKQWCGNAIISIYLSFILFHRKSSFHGKSSLRFPFSQWLVLLDVYILYGYPLRVLLYGFLVRDSYRIRVENNYIHREFWKRLTQKKILKTTYTEEDFENDLLTSNILETKSDLHTRFVEYDWVQDFWVSRFTVHIERKLKTIYRNDFRISRFAIFTLKDFRISRFTLNEILPRFTLNDIRVSSYVEDFWKKKNHIFFG